MLLYSHNTPEILIASFRTKDQVKNSNLCGLVDDNLPDDLSALKGNSLIIKEGPNTLNIDFALALAYNSIRSISSAVQFGKLLIANGANVDVKTINFYVNKIKNGPYGPEIVDYFNNHFNYISGTYVGKRIPFQDYLGVNTGDNQPIEGEDVVDEDFVATIKDIAKSCLSAPANYFSHGGSFGFLSNASQTLNHITSPKTDVTNDKGIGFHSLETFNKMPPLFQGVSTKLNQYASTTHNLFYHSFVGGITAVPTTRADTKGHVLTPNTTTHDNYSKSQTTVLNKVAGYLGDAFRLENFRKLYNPFHYYEEGGPNAEQAAPPGISGMPVGLKIQRDQSLNSIPSPGSITGFTADVGYYTPKKLGINPVYTIENYKNDTMGKIPFVSCTTDDTTFSQGTVLTSEAFIRELDNSLIVFRIIPTDQLAYSGQGPGNGGAAKIGIASNSPGVGLKGVKFTVAGGSNAMITNGGVRQPDPNDCNGIVNNGTHDMSPGTTDNPSANPNYPPFDASGVQFVSQPNIAPIIIGNKVTVDFDGPTKIHPDRVVVKVENGISYVSAGRGQYERLSNKQSIPVNVNGDITPFYVNNLISVKPNQYLFKLRDYVTVCCPQTKKCVRMIVADSGPLSNTTGRIVEISFAAAQALGIIIDKKPNGEYTDSISSNSPHILEVYKTG